MGTTGRPGASPIFADVGGVGTALRVRTRRALRAAGRLTETIHTRPLKTAITLGARLTRIATLPLARAPSARDP